MAKIKLKNGTPVGNEHLCRNCAHGQFTTGYRESEVFVVCTNSAPAHLVPFPVYECTEFWDRHRPSYDEMTKLALDFSQGRRSPTPGFSGRGFACVTVTRTDDDELDEDADLAP
jgi:hypothetical protein